MQNFRGAMTCALMTLAIWMATANPSQADTGTVHVLFSKAGVIAAVGSGKGELTFHGKKYLFEVSGASLGATLAKLHGSCILSFCHSRMLSARLFKSKS